ncbi:MAG: hypothetical protein R3F49_11280 [Planctomycetota bacterium]
MHRDSPLGAQLIALMAGGHEAVGKTPQTVQQSIDVAHLQNDGTVVAYGTGMRFAVEVRNERVTQVCTSHPAYPAFIRDNSREFCYFSQEGRLEVTPHTPGLQLFTPTFMLAPMPVGARLLEGLLQAKWATIPAEQPVDARGVEAANGDSNSTRVNINRLSDGSLWMGFDLGRAPALLPSCCRWFLDSDGALPVMCTLMQWEDTLLGHYPTRTLQLRLAGDRVAVTTYHCVDLAPCDTSDALKLAVVGVKRANVRYGARVMTVNSVEELPEDLRGYISSTTPDTKER